MNSRVRTMAPAQVSEPTLEFGRRLAAALLGVDALYRAESGDRDGLVVLNLDTAGEIPAETFASWAEARRRLTDLRQAAASLPERDRRVYYDQACSSTLAFVAWRDGGLPFTDQLRTFLHVPAQAVTRTELDALQAELHALLGRLGCEGDLARRCREWEQRQRVEPDEAAAVLQDLLEHAWDRTEETLTRIPAPRSDGMRVVAVSGVPFNARCDYRNRRIELNLEPTLTRPGLKHLAVHEGCPGHYLQFKLRETLYREGGAAADVLLSVVNTAGSAVFEGIADAGLMMADWITHDDDRVQAVLGRYRAAIGTVAAWRLHAMNQPEEQVRAWLTSVSLTGGEGWVANRMRFIASPARAVLIWSYWWGEPVVARAWNAVPADRRAAFFHFLHGRMHSTQSIAMFDA